jgi:RNase H-fold protein (predicted Holliday junction resolvase)
MAMKFMQQLNTIRKINFVGVNLAIVVFIGLSYTHVSAQASYKKSIKHVYGIILEDVKKDNVKAELIRFFETNFSELITDIEKSSTKEEEKALVQFLKNEFKQYADVLNLEFHNPEELKNWIIYKQKEYGCMILGRKIHAAEIDNHGKETTDKYKERLRSLLAELLEVKLEKEHNDIIELERRLKELKKIHQIRKDNKDKILQNRFDELVGNQKLFKW